MAITTTYDLPSPNAACDGIGTSIHGTRLSVGYFTASRSIHKYGKGRFFS